MANPGVDNAMWLPLIEKAFSKYHGNYEHIQNGRMAFAARTLMGAPWEELYH